MTNSASFSSGQGPEGAADAAMSSPDLREAVAPGEITVTIRLWKRPKVKVGRRYASHDCVLEIDSIELLPISAVTADDVKRSGEPDLDVLRRRAAHAGPTLVSARKTSPGRPRPHRAQ